MQVSLPDRELIVDACSAVANYQFGSPCTLPGTDDACGVWLCSDGIPVCDPNASTMPQPPLELVCNGLDDDCDGEIDENSLAGQDCETIFNGVPVIGRLTCVGSDAESPYACVCCEPGSDGCTPMFECRNAAVDCEPMVEVCNQTDDDCDGQVDEGPFGTCVYDLGGCYVDGQSVCRDGESTCMLSNPLAQNCLCIPPVIDGGSHYLSCATPHTWQEAESFCTSVSATYTNSADKLQPGTMLGLESGAESLALTTRLYEQRLTTLKTWLNARYEGVNSNQSFDEWFAINFPARNFQNFDAEPRVDDERTVCLSMDADPDYEWSFRTCTADETGAVCEFCPNPNLDEDSDGQSACGGDCNDDDSTIFWGATERCYNGFDDDCDGLIDEGPSGESCPCVARAFNQKVYLFCTDDRASWPTARDACAARSMHLAVFETEDELVGVGEIARVLSNNAAFWIGLRQPDRGADNEGDQADSNRPWRWLQTEMQYPRTGSFWLDGNADGHDRDERDCAFLRHRSSTPYLRADRCIQSHRYICESSIQIQ